MPKVSIIMGIYNTKNREYLDQSIGSILNQTYRNIEFIICDDGSTNDCMKWAKEICKGDNRVLFLKNKDNKGLSYTLNKCMRKAKGDYIARMDDDDYSTPDRIEKQIKFLTDNKDISLVSCSIDLFDDNGVFGETKYRPTITKESFLRNSPIVHAAMMVRADVLKEMNGYSEKKSATRVEDYELFMRMYAAGYKMYMMGDKLYHVRSDINSVKRRQKYITRIYEAKVRLDGFKRLGLLPKGTPYIIKPLILGLCPSFVVNKIKNKRSS